MDVKGKVTKKVEKLKETSVSDIEKSYQVLMQKKKDKDKFTTEICFPASTSDEVNNIY